MGVFERYLTLWVATAIAVGVALGVAVPGIFAAIAALEYASVNLVVAGLIWVMIYRMMVSVDFTSIKDVGRQPKGLVITLVVNWLIKPFTMAALGWLFFMVIFKDLVAPETAREYIAGMILLGVAPCTAMVFVWSQLVKGDAHYTLVQVSVNDLIMVFAFAPITAFFAWALRYRGAGDAFSGGLCQSQTRRLCAALAGRGGARRRFSSGFGVKAPVLAATGLRPVLNRL